VGAVIRRAVRPGVPKKIAIGAAVVGGAAALYRWASGRRPAQHAAQMVRDDSSGPDGDSEPPPWLADVTIQLEASPSTVNLGQSSVVSWSVDLPSGGSAVHVRFNGEPVAERGSRSVAPPRTRTFRILVSGTHLGVYGQTSESVQVEVGYPPSVVIDPSTRDPVQVLIGALVDSTNPQQTVELCDVDLDFTGITSIVVGSDRSLIASPDCARGPRRFGPRIFVTDKRGNRPLFKIRGDNVRFSGFRLEGPTRFIAQGDVKEKGIDISPFAAADPIHNIEISNMEIFHWSGAGVTVQDMVELPDGGLLERGRLFNTNPGAVRIRGNFFHHNRHGAGEGYGVSISAGAYATIEQNVFDENRHAIKGGSKHKDALDYSGYTARDNLILSGGGRHCTESLNPVTRFPMPICWQTHQIDMHGDKNLFYSGTNWQCGTAGETIIIERNTILYTSGLAIKIRGNPADKAVVDGNVFEQKKRSDAIGQNGACGQLLTALRIVGGYIGWYFALVDQTWGGNITNPIDVRPNNQFGVDDLMSELGSGDFFGDGQQDQFMATGVTWWAKSPVTLQWRYLNTMSERLPQLQLEMVDNDAVCDVAIRPPHPGMPPRKYSKSGTGPWTTPEAIED